MRLLLRAAWCLLVLAAWQALPAVGDPLQEMVDAGHLRVGSSIAPATDIVPGQRTRLTLEIATDSWFSGGTRITIPEVPGLVILQTEQFASNASETRGGKTWVIQRWSLDIFPQRAGEFTVGSLPLRLRVNAGRSGDVEGEVHAPPVSFQVVLPPALEQAPEWVAAPDFQVRQQFDHSLEGLAVGDAFEREISFEATDVMAMMLPAFEPRPTSGLAAYPSPPVLDNRVNRGQALASRRRTITYVVEAPGEYLLPAREYFWWNTRSGELALLSLPETRITVAGGSAAQRPAAAPLQLSRQQLLVLVAGLILLATVLRLAWIYLPQLPFPAWSDGLSRQLSRLRQLRKPALPARLNPDSSAGD